MKKLFFILFAALAANTTFAKTHGIDTVKDGFLGLLHFVNGKAKVVIKANLYDINMAQPMVTMKGHPEYPFDRKMLLNEHIYSGSEIIFTINGDTVSAPLVRKRPFITHLKSGSMIYL